VSSQKGIAASIRDIDAAGDEAQMRAGVHGAREAVAVELAAHTPTLTLAAAWSERRSINGAHGRSQNLAQPGPAPSALPR